MKITNCSVCGRTPENEIERASDPWCHICCRGTIHVGCRSNRERVDDELIAAIAKLEKCRAALEKCADSLKGVHDLCVNELENKTTSEWNALNEAVEVERASREALNQTK